MSLNIRAAANAYGVERLGFLTLTFADDLSWRTEEGWREAKRRFNVLATGMLRDVCREWFCTWEPQQSGRLHAHLVVALDHDIRTGFDWEAVGRRDYRSACPELRRLWGMLRGRLPGYGFGRAELLPIKSSQDAIARYVGKYLGKGYADETGTKGVLKGRRWSCSKGWPRVATMRWSFVQGRAQEWRRTMAGLSEVAAAAGEGDIEKAAKAVHGRRWAFHVARAVDRARDDVRDWAKNETPGPTATEFDDVLHGRAFYLATEPVRKRQQAQERAAARRSASEPPPPPITPEAALALRWLGGRVVPGEA